MTNTTTERKAPRGLTEQDWLRLHAGRWVPLPGTGWECLLQGKTKTGCLNMLDIERNATGGPSTLNGWNVPVGGCYLRRRGNNRWY